MMKGRSPEKEGRGRAWRKSLWELSRRKKANAKIRGKSATSKWRVQ